MKTPPWRKHRAPRPCLAPNAIGCIAFACALVLGLANSCKHESRTVLPAASDRSQFPPTEAFYEQQEIQRQRTWDESNVRIEGDDILLPESASGDTQSADYAFYVYAYDPKQPTKTAEQLLAAQELRIDVIGAEATLSFPLTPPRSAPKSDAGSAIRSDSFISGNVVKLTVQSQSSGATSAQLKPFTIVAWFPVRHAMARDEDTRPSIARTTTQPWYSRRDVKVFYGDIRTRVQIVSDTEAQAAFGTEFPRHFYVGRVFLRNRSAERSLAVYTTSMRVPSLFYRKTELAATLPPAVLAAFDAEAQQEFDAEARREFKAEPTALANNVELASRTRQASAFVTAFLANYPQSPNQLPAPGTEPRQELEKSLARRVLAIWAACASRAQPNGESLSPLTLTESDTLIRAALAECPAVDSADEAKAFLEQHPNLPGAIDPPPASNATEADKQAAEKRRAAAARNLVTDTCRARATAAADATATAKQAASSREALFAKIKPKLAAIAADSVAPEAKNAGAVAALLEPWNALNEADTPPLIDQALRRIVAAIDAYKAAAVQRDELVTHARRLAELRLTECRENAVATALRTPRAVAPEFTELIEERITKLRLSILGLLLQASPFATLRPVPVNIPGNPLAFSTNPRLQRQLLEDGYMWRDYYRPMTFQAVLNAVMFTHARDPNTRSVEFLESLARLAGGAVGLSGIFNEVGSPNFAQGVNFFSTILVPELRTRLVEDLKRHITNLGEMSMDTVVIIPPNESFDRYVFFPRGPIYNFPDEFDATTPAYIAAIEGEELFVEAMPIDPGKTLRGGTVDALTLTGRALNEGEKSTQARLLDIAATQAQLRPTELAHLTQRINAIMDSTPADDPAARRRAEAVVRQQVAAFTAYFGTDASGTLSYLLQQHGLSSTDAPPSISPTVPVELLPHSTSVEQTLHVLDDLSTPENLNLQTTVDKPDDLEIKFAAKSLRYQITSRKQDNPVDAEPYTIAFEVTDAGHNVATARQFVKVQPVVFDITHQGQTLSSKRADAAKPVPIGDVPQNSLYALTITAKIYDVDPAKLDLTLRPNPKDPQDKRNPIQSRAATVVPGTRQIRLEAAFDPSGYLPQPTAPAPEAPPATDAKSDGKTKSVEVPLTLVLTQGDNFIVQQDILIEVIPKQP